MLDCMKIWAICGVVALVLVGCDEPGEAVAPRRVGPNATALGFVKAIKAVDPVALSQLTDSPLSEFYTALGEVRDRYADLRNQLLSRYEGANSAQLDASAQQWRLPMTMFEELRLEGLIEGTRTDQSATYRIHYRKKGLRRCSEDLVVEKRDGKWLVVSYGHDTPPEYVIGQIKGQATTLRFAIEPGMKAVERVSPATLEEAVELFWNQAPK